MLWSTNECGYYSTGACDLLKVKYGTIHLPYMTDNVLLSTTYLNPTVPL